MNNNVQKLIQVAESELGYTEKKTNEFLNDKNKNAGNNNYNKYARDICPDMNGQPWCDIFVDWCFYSAFGLLNAKRMLGGFSAYTPTSAIYFKNKKRYYNKPEIGDQIFFKNTIRIFHTGIVCGINGNQITTIEGNTNNSATIDHIAPNGGMVCKKKYDLKNNQIDGYGRPDWSILDNYNIGWNIDENGWWYADSNNTYLSNCWQVINGSKYYFNNHGYALRGWQKIDGKWFFFENQEGNPKECALYVTDSSGEQKIGVF